MQVYQKLAREIDRRIRGNKKGHANWAESAKLEIEKVMREMPSGSGIDCGTKLYPGSTGEKIVLLVEYHHMNENGYYDGRTYHNIIVKPSLQFGFSLRVTGRDKNQIKDYLAEVYDSALREEWKED
jgi:hypothetical protein